MGLFWLTAESTPRGTATISISTMDISASFRVGQSREASSETTGLPQEKEVPKSPFRQLPSQRKYWVKKGSFRPICSRVSAINCSSGIRPMEIYMSRTGSPGEINVSKNVRKLMPISTISICSSRDVMAFLLNQLSPLM